VRIELSSSVIGHESNTSLIEEPSDLDISAGLHELNSSDRTWGDDTRAVSSLSAVCYDSGLNVADLAVSCWGTPQTEISSRVDLHRLAFTGRAFRSRIAYVVSRLWATADRVRVDLVRNSRVRVVIVRQRKWGRRFICRRGSCAFCEVVVRRRTLRRRRLGDGTRIWVAEHGSKRV